MDRFWRKVNKTETCWLWTGYIEKRGYGRFGYNYKTIEAHRMSWIIANGEIPEGMIICHECDNPSCVNPDHLFLGTHKDNTWDMVDKGRHGGSMRGKKHKPESLVKMSKTRQAQELAKRGV